VNRIESQLIILLQQRMRTLNRANGRFVAACVSFKEEDGFREWVRYNDLVVLFIKGYGVRRSREPRLSAFDDPYRRNISIRRPGEYRDTRIRDSIRHQNLLSYWIVCDTTWVTDAGNRTAFGRRPDRP